MPMSENDANPSRPPGDRRGWTGLAGVLKVLARFFAVAIAVGVLVTVVSKFRDVAARTQCINNEKQIGLALRNYESAYRYFPRGTVPNPALAPERRLSWQYELLPCMVGGYLLLVDESKAWDAEENCPPRWRHWTEKGNDATAIDEPIGDLKFFICPACAPRSDPNMPSPTSYVGIAGSGASAAELPLSDPRVGFFGYDRTLTSRDIKKYQANLLVVAHVADSPYWTQGGPATVRGLDVEQRRYVGSDGQFGGPHKNGSGILGRQSVASLCVFADGSVRIVDKSMTPELFEALATLAGDVPVNPW
jgi:hypothetical protein